MLQYVIAGSVLGGIYAIASAGLVVTYSSTGVLNFGFGALAFFIARFYYFLNSQHSWGIVPAAVVAVVVAGPALGVALYFALFRLLRLASPLVKVVATLGVSVVIPPAAVLIFGNTAIYGAPGLAPEPVRVYHVDGVAITLDQVIVYACVILTAVIGILLLRYTDLGLRVRAMVDSPAMTSLSGTSPKSVAVGVWAVSIFLAGLAGVLSAPIIGLAPSDFTLLMAAAFAAVVAAKLRSLPVAVIVAFAMGVAAALVEYFLPSTNSFATAVIPSIPFAVAAIFLIYNMARWGRVNETEGVGGALDRAITPQGTDSLAGNRSSHQTRLLTNGRSSNWQSALLAVSIVIVLPWVLGGLWVGLVAQGVAFSVVFLSFTLVTGEGGMIWLCQVTFAGVGAVVAAQFATNHGWPVLAAVVMGGLFALPMGLVIGLLTIRLGDLYVALVTLTFGLLMDNLVFSIQTFQNSGIGVNLSSPDFAQSSRALVYVGLVVFCVIGLLIVNLRRSTTGLALSAVRWSEPGAKTLGISVLQMKVIVAGLAAMVAGIGGGLLAITNGVALPANYATLGGVLWLAVLVTNGIRSNIAALVAGLVFAISPGLALAYLPSSFTQALPMLFGIGAIMLARNPDGVVVLQGQQIRWLIAKVRRPQLQVATADRSPGEPDRLAATGSSGVVGRP
jgi:branched-chain amino acid transport system permease protein